MSRTVPNLLIVMTDHQRADTVLPEHPALTPNLTRFAQEGVTFTHTFCPAPHCCPSRATFFSGLYPSQHGVWNNVCNEQALSHGLNPGVRLWSEDLAAAGYDLHFAGKWHVSVEESPKNRGWTEHFVSGAAGTHHGENWAHYRELAARHEEPHIRRAGEIVRPGYKPYVLYGSRGEAGDAHDERVAQIAVDVLPQLARQQKPWGLYVGLVGPHDPYYVPQKYLDQYRLEDVPLPPSYADDLADKPRLYQRMRQTRFDQLSEDETRDAIRHFWAYCTYLDDLFGRVLKALDATGQADNTLVIYCADHGDYVGEHGLFAKGLPCFQGAYHVPNIMRWPAGITNPGRRVEAFVSLADFVPTFLELAEQPARPLTGMSLRPFLRDATPAAWRDAIHTQCNGVELYYKQRSVMTRDWKYVCNGFDFDELYDLRRDPHELRNLAAESDYEPIKRELCRRMWQFAYQTGDTSLLNSYITVGLAPYGPAEAF